MRIDARRHQPVRVGGQAEGGVGQREHQAAVAGAVEVDVRLQHGHAHLGQAGTGIAADEAGVAHINFNGTCHGGLVFALADTAFGLAANSHGLVAAGIDAHITYQAPVRAGDVLVARANEVSRSRRLAVYRVDVTRAADGRATHSFTGTVFITETPHALPP